MNFTVNNMDKIEPTRYCFAQDHDDRFYMIEYDRLDEFYERLREDYAEFLEIFGNDRCDPLDYTFLEPEM